MNGHWNAPHNTSKGMHCTQLHTRQVQSIHTKNIQKIEEGKATFVVTELLPETGSEGSLNIDQSRNKTFGDFL
jgi:hypothetical protein